MYRSRNKRRGWRGRENQDGLVSWKPKGSEPCDLLKPSLTYRSPLSLLEKWKIQTHREEHGFVCR